MDNTTLVQDLSLLFHKRGWTLAIAESCTGGLLGDMITDLPGSSAFFLGGVTTYSNTVKTRVLGIPIEILEEKGAVSPETALAMARGVRTLFDSSVGVAITGIAGPKGGSREKPVGLVYLSVITPGEEVARRFIFAGNRREIKIQATNEAITLILNLNSNKIFKPKNP